MHQTMVFSVMLVACHVYDNDDEPFEHGFRKPVNSP